MKRSIRTVVASLVLAAAVALPALPSNGQNAGGGTGGGGTGAGNGDALTAGGGARGDANGQVITVSPMAGRLALPIKLVTSGARVEGDVSRASSATVDAGLLGSLATLAITGAPTLAQLGLDTSAFRSFSLPGSTNADSRTVPSAEATPVFPRLNLEVVDLRGGYQSAKAQPKGDGHGRTEGGSFVLNLGPAKVEASGLLSESIAGQAQSSALTAIGELKLTGFGIGAVMRGLEWKVSQAVGQPAVAGFALGSFEFGPLKFTNPDIGQIATAMAQLNAALAPTGLAIELPRAEVSEAGGKITPLRIVFRDSQLGAAVLGPPYEAILSPVVNQLEAAIVAGLPETGLAITVANIGIAAAVGRGGVGVDLGGADARSFRTPLSTYTYSPLESDQEDFEAPDSGNESDSFTSADVGEVSSGSFATSDSFTADASRGGFESAPAGEVAAPPATTGEDEFALSAPAPASVFGRHVEEEEVPAGLLLGAGILSAIGLALLDRRRIQQILGVAR